MIAWKILFLFVVLLFAIAIILSSQKKKVEEIESQSEGDYKQLKWLRGKCPYCGSKDTEELTFHETSLLIFVQMRCMVCDRKGKKHAY